MSGIGENYGTIWVCVDCMLHHANGECGSCHSERGHDREPLSAIGDGFTVAMGMASSEHDGTYCLRGKIAECKAEYPDVEWPDVPDGFECDCEQDNFSRSQCAGCGSQLHGAREAMTLYKLPEPVEPCYSGKHPMSECNNLCCKHCGQENGH